MSAPAMEKARGDADVILAEVERAIVGKREVLELVLIGILSGGHVLLEDVPGLAKTLMARSFANALGLDFSRIQFTPDLLPADITGSSIFDQRSHRFDFRRGPHPIAAVNQIMGYIEQLSERIECLESRIEKIENRSTTDSA